ncbi:MAG: response regulator [Rhodospirillaceae bacterium]|nr:response regulator [Rhodospirillaceae bacterium]
MSGQLRVLVIDDSTDDTELLLRQLRRDGFDLAAERTETVEGLKAALEAQDWDVVLCDYRLPGFSGMDALAVVQEARPDLPFIFVSGVMGEDVAVAAMKAGAQDYITKSSLRRLGPAIARELRDAILRRQHARAEARRSAMEARYRQILSLAPDAIVTLDEAFRITLFNLAAERLFECPAVDLIGQSIDVLLPPELAPVMRRQLIAFFTSGEGSAQIALPGQLRFQRSSLTVFPAEAYVSRLIEEGRTIFTLIIRDTTDRETMIATMQQTNQALDAVVQSSPVAILGIDSLRRVIVWNKNAEKIFGIPAASIVGQPYVSLLRDGTEDLNETFQRLLAGQVLRDVEASYPGIDGSPNLRISGAPLYDAEGRVRGAVCIVEDTTEGKVMQRQLEHAQRMETVGQLTGGLAHDFNNLLAVVIGNLDLLQTHIRDVPAAQEPLELAMKASLGGAALIRQLLAFSRRQALSPRSFDLGAVVTATRELFGRTLGEQIEVKCEVATDLWPALADPSQVESAIANLAINARDAMPEGGLLTLEVANVHLDQDYATSNIDVAPGDYVMVAVSDTGRGIPPELLGRVFEPFFSTKEHGKGSGLGLSMVYGFAKQSRGHVKIYSEVDHGTTVRLYLPRAIDVTAPMALPALDEPGAVTLDADILVVEDNPDVRKVVCQLLRDLGCNVVEAANAAAALTILESDRHIDLLFTDIVMPGGMAGTELARAARRLRPGLKTLLTSGFAEGSIRAANRADGFDDILSKPYRRQDLIRKMVEILGRDQPVRSAERR